VFQIKKHSDVYYIYAKGSFQAVKQAKTHKNAYGLDLFIYDEKIYEGRSGAIVAGSFGMSSTIEAQVERIGGIEKFNAIIDKMISKYGESPRYLRSDEQKKNIFPPKEKDKDIVFVKDACDGKKHYYHRFHTENNINFYSLK